MKRATILWIIWGILLLGQIVLDVVAFPRLLDQSGWTDRMIFGLVISDVLGIGAWIVGWYVDQTVTPRTWRTNVIIVLCAVLALLIVRVQLYVL